MDDNGADLPLFEYRLFLTNSRGRIFRVAREIEAPTDQAAIETAQDFLGELPAELWLLARKVATFNMPTD